MAYSRNRKNNLNGKNSLIRIGKNNLNNPKPQGLGYKDSGFGGFRESRDKMSRGGRRGGEKHGRRGSAYAPEERLRFSITGRDWLYGYFAMYSFVPMLVILGVYHGCLLAIQLIRLLRKKVRQERYHEQARQRRSLRKPHSDNPPPSPEMLAAQWDKVHDSLEEVLRFGSMLVDLEASDLIDNSPILNYDTANGVPEIVARNPGLKGWLARHCPHIGYKTAMRYKSIFQKAQQVPRQTSSTMVKNNLTIHDLHEGLYKELKISHYKLRHPRKPPARPDAIHAFRAKARPMFRALSPEDRQRFVVSLHAFANELAASQ